MAKRDAIVFGLRAAQAVAEYRPESILRVLYVEEVKRRLVHLKATAAQRKPYRQVTKADPIVFVRRLTMRASQSSLSHFMCRLLRKTLMCLN